MFAALAIGRLIEDRTGWSIRKFVRTARRYRTVHIRAAGQLLTAEDPLPAELRETLTLINEPSVRTNLSQVGSEADDGDEFSKNNTAVILLGARDHLFSCPVVRERPLR